MFHRSNLTQFLKLRVNNSILFQITLPLCSQNLIKIFFYCSVWRVCISKHPVWKTMLRFSSLNLQKKQGHPALHVHVENGGVRPRSMGGKKGGKIVIGPRHGPILDIIEQYNILYMLDLFSIPNMSCYGFSRFYLDN